MVFGEHLRMYSLLIYRHSSFYCASLYCASLITAPFFFFKHTEGLWQPRVEQVYQHHFSKSICSLHVSVSHFGISRSISNFFILFIYFFNKFINLFIYLFLAALGLRCCARAFSGCGEWGLLFVAVHRLLIAVASFVVEHEL